MLIDQDEVANLTDKFLWGQAVTSYILSKFEGEAGTRTRFPCVFAQRVVKQGNLRFLLVPYALEDRKYELDYLARGLRTYIEQINVDALRICSHRPLLVLFEPVSALSTREQFNHVFIEAMQYLLDQDQRPWPAHVSQDPAHRTWTMCYHDCELFVNVSHPAHVLRKSRNMGAGLAFVINPRKIFDIAAPANRWGEAVTAKIRRNVDKYDDIPHSPLLGSYLHGKAQWPQYMIPDNNEEAPLPCHLRFDRL
ncbi:hypothetical protein HL667_32120 [Bradyrhizobium sp. 83012]|uniref:YqcI/YcgG family protein n=1 Tax=Bradyrhizobium aeschynomenes TaxID=2734909 RepID=A0ABX2CP12_9BRAD|nr:YqcI/YcgG family protein [Bradyrhizobium aeschynomenes]NPU15741.1 hypothetical protein [Bradyrhizobium aeschynomenes]NPU69688.1 hypothetical protein [Bradyrhizobium aeschynomenes]NPV24629.1 hypothetical protein [Bradyrhizobium aeschynomenes]